MLFLLFSTLGFFLGSVIKIIICVLSFTALAVFITLFICKKISNYSSIFIIICLLAIIFSLLSSLIFFNIRASSYEKYYGEEHTISATVTEEIYQSGNLSSYKINVESIDGEHNRHLSELTCYYNPAFEIGDKFELTVTAENTDEDYPTRYNSKLSRLSDGVFILYSSWDQSSLKITGSNTITPSVIFSHINAKLSKTLASAVSGEEGKLASAILLGNRDLLSNSTKRDFSRAGAAHILAISGLHMSILMGALMYLCKKLGMKTRLIAIVMIIISLTYLGITGFSISATRSVIMLTIVYLSMLASVPSDPLTSLSIAGTVIVLISPGSVLDAGFWMSFSATLGILSYMPSYIKFKNNAIYHIKRFRTPINIGISFISAIATGIFAMIPLVIIMCVFIREVSIFSVLSSVILSLATSFILVLSLLLIPFAKIPYISYTLASAIRAIAGFMLSYCGKISDIEGAVFSLNYSFSNIFVIILGIALLCSLIFKFKNVFISLVPYFAFLLIFIGTITLYEFKVQDTVKVSYINASSKSDMIVISNGGEAIVCDIGNGSNKSFNLALNEVYASRATEISAVILTHYENTYPSSLQKLFSTQKVRQLWLPVPQNEADYYKMLPIIEKARLEDVALFTYDVGSTLSAFSFVNIDLQIDNISRSKEEIVLISIYGRRDRLTYASPAFNESSLNDIASFYFGRSDYVVFGNKGAKTFTDYSIPDGSRVRAIAFADDIRAAYFDTPDFDVTYFTVPDKIDFYFEK
ncbi:MAG: ComEC/Rec2 family competence protein [Clostridia bacterium]|nr:ComEC/Rec2 family competence protein [Clostridia bacterium]